MDYSNPKQDQYLATFKMSQRTSGVQTAIMNLAGEVTGHIMKNIHKDPKSGVFRVLGVGSGRGQPDLRILSVIAKAVGFSQKRKPAIHATIIEPSALIDEFQSLVALSPQPLADVAEVSFEWHKMTLQQFFETSARIEHSFDVIHFLASVYYMDAEKALTDCYQRLACGGAMFCTVGPEESFYPKLSRKLPGVADLGSVHKLYTEVDLVNIARRKNWRYEELWKTQYTADISSCFDESSQKGSILLDFLTHKREFRDTADEKLYKEVMEFLNDESTINENGKKVIKPEITAVVIYK